VAATKAILRGENVSEKTAGIHREEVLKIVKGLLQDGGVDAAAHRCIMLLLYHSVGRAIEASTCNFDLFHWDETQSLLWTGWNQTKTGRSTALSYTSHASTWESDVIHAMACHIVVAGATLHPDKIDDGEGNVEDAATWLLPKYASMKGGGCAKKVNAVLKQSHKDKHASDSWSSHGFKVGACDDLAFEPSVPFLSIVARADWSEKGENSAFHYISRPMLVTKAGTTEPSPKRNAANRQHVANTASLLPCLT
jgi:hypothetical protein